MHVNNVGKRLLNKNLATATLPLWDLVGGGRCRAGRKWETSQVNSIKKVPMLSHGPGQSS